MKKYDPNYGDQTPCKCGHTYVRHHDPFEFMLPVGCKYCGCKEFVPLDGEPPKGQNVYYTDLLYGSDFSDPAWFDGEPKDDGIYLIRMENRFTVIERVDGTIIELPNKTPLIGAIKRHHPIPNPNLFD